MQGGNALTQEYFVHINIIPCNFWKYLRKSKKIHERFNCLLGRAVHGSVRVGFVPNSDSTRLHRVGEKFNP